MARACTPDISIGDHERCQQTSQVTTMLNVVHNKLEMVKRCSGNKQTSQWWQTNTCNQSNTIIDAKQFKTANNTIIKMAMRNRCCN